MQTLVIILLVALFLQEVLSMRLMSASSDEMTHLPSGYTYLKTSQFRLNPQHPPFIKLLCALPLLFLNPTLNLDDPNWKNNPPNEWKFGYSFLYTNDADSLLFWGRLPVVFLSLLLGFYLYKWTRELFGAAAGLMALFLYVFCPNILAHSRFVTMDIGLSCFFLITLYYFWRFVHSRGNPKRNLIYTGVNLGLALATKFSAIILLPILALLLGLATLWPPGTLLKIPKTGQSMKYHSILNSIFIPEGLSRRIKFSVLVYFTLLILAGLVVYAIYFFPRDPLFYWNGMMLVNKDHDPDYQAYLMGEFKKGGWWYYFLLAFLFKTQVPILILLVLSLIFFKRYPSKHWLDEAFLILPILIFVTFTSAFANNLGLRYLLPIYPLLFIFISRLADFFLRNRITLAAIFLLAVWYLTNTLLIYPDYLAYFNELVGGPEQGHKYLDDSNIDWGQDLKRLKIYMDAHGIDKIKLIYSWSVLPNYYRIKGERVSAEDWYVKPSPGIYAINTHALIRGELLAKTRNAHSNWLSRYQPIDRVGYSFYIFKFHN